MSFKDKVTAWISADESSGVRANSHTTGATYDLAEVNGVGSAAGLQGNAAVFVRADIDYLVNANGLYRFADDVAFLMAVWNINSDGAAQIRTIASRFGGSGADLEYRLNSIPSTPRLDLHVYYNTSGGFNTLTVSTTGLHSDADPGWDIIAFGRRSLPSPQLWISINGGALQTVAATASPNTAGTIPFQIGSSNPGAALTARIDELVYCAGGVVEADIAEYYNGGAIVSYEDIFPSATVPDAPTLLTATATAGTKIALGWVDNSDDETGFKVERSLNGTTGWTLINTTAANATTYTDDSLTPGVTRFYRVAATNAEGDSAYTSTASATTLIGEGTVVLTDTRPTAVLTDTRPTVVLTDTRPTVVLTEL